MARKSAIRAGPTRPSPRGAGPLFAARIGAEEPGLQDGRIGGGVLFQGQGGFFRIPSPVLTQEQHGQDTPFFGIRMAGTLLCFRQQGEQGGNRQQMAGGIKIRQQENIRYITGGDKTQGFNLAAAYLQD